MFREQQPGGAARTAERRAAGGGRPRLGVGDGDSFTEAEAGFDCGLEHLDG